MFKVAPVLFYKYFQGENTIWKLHWSSKDMCINAWCLWKNHLENAKNLICTPEIFIGHKKYLYTKSFSYAMKTLYVCLI